MSRAIEIARNGLGTTAPNPMVGAVLIHDEKIIGEGFTSPFGGPHAEVNAIASVADKGLLKTATLYVILEPCSHFGKTPPCADLVIAHKIPTVVIGLADPHEKVAGKGIAKLKKAGIDVVTGVLEAECRAQQKRFLTFHEKKRPYIILKWAETADGFMAPETGMRSENPQPFWISNAHSRQLTHQWRSEEQAVLVGTTTVLEDNPRLDVRHWTGKNPIRIVLDRALKINGDYHVLDGSVSTWVLTEVRNASRFQRISRDQEASRMPEPSHLRKGPDERRDIGYRRMDFSKDIPQHINRMLHEGNIQSVLIEGGARTLQSFIDVGLWDEARIFTGTSFFKKGLKAPVLSGKLIASKTIGSDRLKILRNQQMGDDREGTC